MTGDRVLRVPDVVLPIDCIRCGREIPFERTGSKFCSTGCFEIYQQEERINGGRPRPEAEPTDR